MRKLLKIKRIVVTADHMPRFIMRNGDILRWVNDKHNNLRYENQWGQTFAPLFDEDTDEIVGFTEMCFGTYDEEELDVQFEED